MENEKDLLYNLETGNIDTLIIPLQHSFEVEAEKLQLEKILRTCYAKNIDLSVRDDFHTTAAITRNEVLVQNN